ncbi:MAG: hypothetical protein CL897_04265 [Dehalococcoidia bacterium]|nr:hypothetical protein [Dehalococcoidia bacterium]|tara:strand:- start:2755 stop:2994 length:240 start_codon:yes stop_codon:yes gene_type:complete
MVDETTRKAYREAWDRWMKQLDRVHDVLLEEQSLTPDRLKGLLNREARAKQTYDEARLKLLGIDETADRLPPGSDNPFR